MNEQIVGLVATTGLMLMIFCFVKMAWADSNLNKNKYILGIISGCLLLTLAFYFTERFDMYQ